MYIWSVSYFIISENKHKIIKSPFVRQEIISISTFIVSLEHSALSSAPHRICRLAITQCTFMQRMLQRRHPTSLIQNQNQNPNPNHRVREAHVSNCVGFLSLHVERFALHKYSGSRIYCGGTHSIDMLIRTHNGMWFMGRHGVPVSPARDWSRHASVLQMGNVEIAVFKLC